MAIVVEITDKVRIEQELEAERKSLKRMFEQAPGFIAMASGPEHRFTMVNEAYRTLVAGRDVVGRTIAEALPEVVEQGFVSLLDRVYASDEPYVGRRERVNLQQGPDGALNGRYLDFIYQPIVADNGATTGIFIQGHDVTEQHETEQAIRAESRKLDVLNRSGAALAAELDVDKVVQIATDACTELVGAEFGTFFYNVTNDKGRATCFMPSPACRGSTSTNFPCRATRLYSSQPSRGPASSAPMTSAKILVTGRMNPITACPKDICRCGAISLCRSPRDPER